MVKWRHMATKIFASHYHVDSSWIRFSGTHLKALSKEDLKIPTNKIRWEITFSKLPSYVSGANGFRQSDLSIQRAEWQITWCYFHGMIFCISSLYVAGLLDEILSTLVQDVSTKFSTKVNKDTATTKKNGSGHRENSHLTSSPVLRKHNKDGDHNVEIKENSKPSKLQIKWNIFVNIDSLFVMWLLLSMTQICYQ